MKDEIFPESFKSDLFRIDHSLADETEEAYFERKARAIEQGLPTWFVGNFESDSPVYRFWTGKMLAALIEPVDGKFRVHVRNPAEFTLDVDTVEDDMTLHSEHDTLEEAITVAETYWGIQT